MKTIIAAAALMVVSATVQASAPINCQSLGKLAELVMTERQQGTPMHQYVTDVKAAMESGKLSEKGGGIMLSLIQDAYQFEAYPFLPELQRSEAVEFSNKITSWCYSEYGM